MASKTISCGKYMPIKLQLRERPWNIFALQWIPDPQKFEDYSKSKTFSTFSKSGRKYCWLFLQMFPNVSYAKSYHSSWL